VGLIKKRELEEEDSGFWVLNLRRRWNGMRFRFLEHKEEC